MALPISAWLHSHELVGTTVLDQSATPDGVFDWMDASAAVAVTEANVEKVLRDCNDEPFSCTRKSLQVYYAQHNNDGQPAVQSWSPADKYRASLRSPDISSCCALKVVTRELCAQRVGLSAKCQFTCGNNWITGVYATPQLITVEI